MKETTFVEDSWLDEAKLQTGLQGNKGKIVGFGTPVLRQTKFGARKFVPVVIEGTDGKQISVGIALPPQFPQVHPKSTLGKLMAMHAAVSMRALIGKEVNLEQVGDTMWKIKV